MSFFCSCIVSQIITTFEEKIIMETGKLIKNLRIKKGMTQEELADQTELSTRTIQRIENGEVDPRSYSLQMIAKALEVEYDIFLENESEQEIEKNKKDRFNLGMLHLSGILPLFFPSILLYHNKKKTMKGMRDHFYDVIILQLVVWFIIIIPGTLLYFFFEINGFINKLPYIIVIWIIMGALFSIGNAINVFNGRPHKKLNFFNSNN